MISYLLEASAYHIAFYLLYHIGLRQDTFFDRNRAYLLISALSALLLPLLEVPVNPMITTLALPNWPILSPSNIQYAETSAINRLTLLDFICYVYGTVVAGLSLHFIYQLVQIVKIIHRHRVTVHQGYRLVHTDAQIPLSSFFCFIFWNRAVPTDNASHLLLQHELHHVRSRHTYDLLALRMLKIAFWFNPIIYYYHRSLQAQHEYSADRAVADGTSLNHYQQLLISYLFSSLSLPLTHRFNQIHLKTRIAMMNRTRTSQQHLLTPLFAIPVTIVLLLFYNPGTAQIAFHAMKETPINTLYLHCGNALTLDLPDASGKVTYDIQGGELLTGEEDHQVIIIPNQSEVTLHVLDGQKNLKDYHFRVRRVPLPGIVLRYDTISSTNNIRIHVNQVPTLSVHAVPNEDLGRFLPRDARFKLLGTVSLMREDQLVRTISFDGSFDPNALGAVQTGDEIKVSVEKLLRMDFRGEIEEIEMATAQVLKASIL